ncbi:MAG: flagellar type III secretion system pore protein FliP [Thermodesulfobacteriota bacterium]
MNRRRLFLILAAALTLTFSGLTAWAFPVPTVSIGLEEADSPAQMATVLQILLLLTVLTLAPAILIMMTSFVRLIVVFSFLRHALGTQTMPPSQIIVGLALFLTVFIMRPVWTSVNDQAVKPFLAHEISQQEAYDRAAGPVRDFMFRQTREKDLALFMNLAQMERPKNKEDVPISALIPAFTISELKTAFTIGFILYVPFLVIDMVVASVLLSMGMMMLPPIMVSLPFKLMLFVLVDGWNLIVGSLVKSFG